MTTRRKRWPRRLLTLLLLTAGLLAITYFAVLPWYTRLRISQALEEFGIARHSFDMPILNPAHLRLSDVELGPEPWMTVDQVDARYSLTDLWNGQVGPITIDNAVWTVRVRDGKIDWGIPEPPPAGKPETGWPFSEIRVNRGLLRLDWNGTIYEAPISGALIPRDDLFAELKATVDLFAEAIEIGATVARSGVDGGIDVNLASASLTGDLQAPPAPEPGASDARIARFSLEFRQFKPALEWLARNALKVEGEIAVAVQGEAVIPKGDSSGWTASISQANVRVRGADISWRERVRVIGLESDFDLAATLRQGECTIDITRPAQASCEDLAIETARQTFIASGVEIVQMEQSPRHLAVIDWSGGKMNWQTHVGMRTRSAVSLAFGDMTAALDQLDLQMAYDTRNAQPLDLTAHAEFGASRLAPLEMSSGRTDVSATDFNQFTFSNAALDLGGHGRFFADPFTVSVDRPEFNTTVSADHVGLGPWLSFLTNDRMTAEGQVEGRLTLGFDPAARDTFTFGNGVLESNPRSGWVQVRDPEMVEAIVNEQFDPRSTDQTVRALRGRIMNALQDFEYSELRIDFEPWGGDTLCRLEAIGRGRTAERQEFAGLVVNVNNFASAFNEALRLKAAFEDLTEEVPVDFFEDR